MQQAEDRMTAIGDAYLEVVSTLTSAGFTVAESSAAIRPPCVVVDPPDISTISATLVELTFPVSPVVAPPGDRRALDELLDAVDTIAGLFPISSSTAAIYTAGPQDLPSYRLTVPMTIRRDVPMPVRSLGAFVPSPIVATSATVTTGATAHQFGPWTELVPELATSGDQFYLTGSFVYQTYANESTVLEIGLGPSGSETAILSGLTVGSWSGFDLPIDIAIPAGSRISVRAASVVTSWARTVSFVVLRRPPLVSQSRSSATVYGVDPATSSGIAVGTSYTEIATLTGPADYVTIVPSDNRTSSAANGTALWSIATGDAGAEIELGVVSFTFNIQAIISDPLTLAYPWTFVGPFPTGTRFAVKKLDVYSGADASLIAFHN
jgi:hypothetical protein